MSSPRPVRIRLLILVCIAVCAVATVLGWVAGGLGTYLYDQIFVEHELLEVIPESIGNRVGAASGFLAGLLWCRLVVPISLRQVAGIRSLGGLAGLGAGVFGATLLHLTLMFTQGDFHVNPLAVGLGMAAPVGLVLGVLAGQLCRMAVTTTRAFRGRPHARRVIHHDGPVPGPDFMEQLDVRSTFRPRPPLRDEYDA